MKKRALKITNIISNLHERVNVACRIFNDLCLNTPLLDIFGKDRSCAIVGGAVRDVLLMPDPWTLQMFPMWRDIDIAVVDDLSELPIVVNSASKYSAVVSSNTFGGLKISHKSLGSLDVWTWRKPGLNNTSLKDWKDRLNMAEFGLNAVAFIWPQRKIIIHQRWIEDLSEGPIVEKLNQAPMRRAIQTMRAIALSAKLEASLGIKVILGKLIKKDLQWLVKDATRPEIEEGLFYLKHKIDIDRWPKRTVHKLSVLSKGYAHSFIFEEVAYAILGKYPLILGALWPNYHKIDKNT